MRTLYAGKLPRGWSRRIPGHYESHPSNSNKRIRSPEYESYYSMLQRCYSKFQRTYPKNEKYQLEGVKVCTRWVLGDGTYNGFQCFLLDLGHRAANRTLDRIDPEGHYEPGNCRWSTTRQQSRNRRVA
jgi:hypothetical protein